MTHLYLKLFTAFIATLTLSILPLPALLSVCRPPWTLLLVVYVEYFLPGKLQLITLLLIGVVLDVLLSTVLGEHAFALLLVTWLASTKSRRFQFFSMAQQICIIGLFCFLYQTLIIGIDAVLTFNYTMLMPIASTLSGMFIWPWVRVLGDGAFSFSSQKNTL